MKQLQEIKQIMHIYIDLYNHLFPPIQLNHFLLWFNNPFNFVKDSSYDYVCQVHPYFVFTMVCIKSIWWVDISKNFIILKNNPGQQLPLLVDNNLPSVVVVFVEMLTCYIFRIIFSDFNLSICLTWYHCLSSCCFALIFPIICTCARLKLNFYISGVRPVYTGPGVRC